MNDDLQGHLARNETMWRAWRKDGVTERTPLTVDFNFSPTSKATAERLAAALREVGLESVEVGRIRGLWEVFRGWAVWGVEGGTWSLERLQDRTRTFCQLAARFRCRMEACGAEIPHRNDSEPGTSPNGSLAKHPAERTMIEAEITFLSESEGGRDIPDGSLRGISWRPWIVIGDPSQRQAVIGDGNQLTEAYFVVVFCDGPQHVEPGQPARTTMALHSQNTDYSAAVPGATFTVRYERILGYGKIERRWTEAWTVRDLVLKLRSSPEME